MILTQATIAPAETFRLQPYTDHCGIIATTGDHAVIGVSPGNSFFSAQRVTDLAHWSLEHFGQVDLVYTDLHVDAMYEALGYSPVEARRKAVKNLRGVRAKVTNAALHLDPSGDRLRARPVSALTGIPAYKELQADVLELLRTDDDFRSLCDELAEIFLAGKLAPEEPITDEQRAVCRAYVCAEVPLFLDSPAIFGVASSLNCYHQALPLADLLYARGAGLRASRNQGHGILTPAEGAAV